MRVHFRLAFKLQGLHAGGQSLVSTLIFFFEGKVRSTYEDMQTLQSFLSHAGMGLTAGRLSTRFSTPSKSYHVV